MLPTGKILNRSYKKQAKKGCTWGNRSLGLNCHYPYISNIPVHAFRKIKFPGLSLAGTRGAMHDPRVILQDIEEAELHEACPP